MANATATNRLQRLINKKNKNEIDRFVFGRKVDLITTLFGCWHNNISRPFVNGKTGYRSCLQCGARKQFNTETLETNGRFYFPPVTKDARI